MTDQEYFERFFEEKEIPFGSWEFVIDGTWNYIDSEVVIEAIMSAPENEQKKIRGTLVKLDFVNAPILPYLKFLAECMIKTQAKGL